MIQKVEQSIIADFEQSSEPRPSRVGNTLVTEAHRKQEEAELLEYANADAASKWQQLQNNSEKDIKFSLSDIAELIPSERLVLSALCREKAVEKSLDEAFWAAVSEHETQNEAEFSVFWLERVVSRCHIYNEGLSAVEDQKLQGQLAELFATYARKELLLDALLKARSQGLALSRKTRKNLQKLETKLQVDADAATIMTTLDRFNKKQSIDVPAASSLQQAKQAMVQDMNRRMQKQKKSDGPVLFLTLVILLFARHYPGVVYATGKFAPKLLKQLKSVLDASQYEQVERWKEAAKTSTLSAEDREEMRRMVEA